jgi:thiamine-phosphate pyrophosphorylase
VHGVRPSFQLIVITDGASDLIARVRKLAVALSPDVALLLRDKQASQAALREQAQALRSVTREHGAALLVSEHVEIALQSDADGVHLPELSRPLAEARNLLGDRLLGVSRHDLPGLLAAEQAGADYATLSPVFASPGKGTPLGLEAFAQSASATRLPLFALGGVTANDVRALARAGAAGVAVIREVLATSDPARALAALLSALTDARSS